MILLKKLRKFVFGKEEEEGEHEEKFLTMFLNLSG